MTRDTTLTSWGAKSDSLPDLTAWRDKLAAHIRWIAAERGDVPIYARILDTYRRELITASQQIANLKKPERAA